MIEILEGLAESLTWLLIVGILYCVFCYAMYRKYSLSIKVETKIRESYIHYQAYEVLRLLIKNNNIGVDISPYTTIVDDMSKREIDHINNLVRIFNDNRPFWRSEIEIIFEVKQ